MENVWWAPRDEEGEADGAGPPGGGGVCRRVLTLLPGPDDGLI